jgi:ABC-type uncharacterized transport system substrate-binding protein
MIVILCNAGVRPCPTMNKALLERLGQLGWRSDNNLEIDLRWGGMDLDQIKKSAKELVEARPDVIQVTTTPATAAILRETHTVPVVFAIVSDPVGSGFVQSLAHPGGNATGFVNIEGSIGTKWLEILKQIAPDTSHVSVPFNPNTSPQSLYYLKSLEAAAPALALTVSAAHVSSAEGIEAAVADVARVAGGGLVIIPDIFTAVQAQRDLIISLAARHRIPAVYYLATSVTAGGLVSYGVDNPDLLSRSATTASHSDSTSLPKRDRVTSVYPSISDMTSRRREMTLRAITGHASAVQQACSLTPHPIEQFRLPNVFNADHFADGSLPRPGSLLYGLLCAIRRLDRLWS